MAVVAVDATVVGTRSNGAGRAIANLLAVLPDVDERLHYVALTGEDGAAVLAAVAPRVSIVRVRPRGGIAWELRGAGEEAARAGADLLFTVREISPQTGPPTIVHVYEPPAYRLRSPDLRTGRGRRAFGKDVLLHLSLPRSLRRAAAVTAGSRTTADWLRAHIGVEAPVVLPGVDPVFLVEHSLPSPDEAYVLHPATGDPRENTTLVLDAFSQSEPPPVRLTLVGLPERSRARLAEEVGRRGIAERVELLGWVPDDELRRLYAQAVALVHPTRYESYAGLPTLEAMALGTPVVALDAPGSTEALAGAAVLLPAEDPALLAAELRHLVESPELRRRLGEGGRVLAAKLTWPRAAAGFVDVFRALCR